jgi:hypothetical protein
MKKTCLFLTLLTAIVVSVGFYRGWFSVSGSRDAVSQKVDVSLTVDPEKAEADAELVKDKAKDLTGSGADIIETSK